MNRKLSIEKKKCFCRMGLILLNSYPWLLIIIPSSCLDGSLVTNKRCPTKFYGCSYHTGLRTPDFTVTALHKVSKN